MFGRKGLYSCLLSVTLLLHCHSALAQLVDARPNAPAPFALLSQPMVTTGLDVLLGLAVNSNIDHLLNAGYDEFHRLRGMLYQEPPEAIELELRTSWAMQLSRVLEENPEYSLSEAMQILREGSVVSAGDYHRQEEVGELLDQLANLHDIDDVSVEISNITNQTVPVCEGILVLGNVPSTMARATYKEIKESLPDNKGEEDDDEDDSSDDDFSVCSFLTIEDVKAELPDDVVKRLHWTIPSSDMICAFLSENDGPLQDELVDLIDKDPSGEQININADTYGTFSKVYIPSTPFVVLKFPRPSLDVKLEEAEGHIKNEIAILSRLSAPAHASVISMKAVVYCQRYWVLVMENGGMDMIWWLNNESKMVYAQRISLAKQVLSVLDFLHERGIYHRDMKLENLLLSNTGQALLVKLIDFGKACSKDDQQRLMSVLLGTRGYLAPEHFGKRNIFKESSEIFATGVTLAMLVPCDHHDPNACDIMFTLLQKYNIDCSVKKVNVATVEYHGNECTPFDFVSLYCPHLLSEFMGRYKGKFSKESFSEDIWSGKPIVPFTKVVSRKSETALQLLCAQMTRAEPENRMTLKEVIHFLKQWLSYHPSFQ